MDETVVAARHPNHIGPEIDLADRLSIIRWLCWNDPNGVYSDTDSSAEGMEPITLPEALALYAKQTSDL